jgi:hypothetical protein
MKKNEKNEKVSKKVAAMMKNLRKDELEAVTGGACTHCGLIVSAGGGII